MNVAVRSVLLSGCSAGVGLWCAQAALDIVSSPRGPVRVAFLPPLWWLAVCAVAGALVVAAIAVLLTRVVNERRILAPAPAAPVSDAVADALLPLHALWVLALPYLPWLPDMVPVVRVTASPALWAVAGVVVLQVVVAVSALLRRPAAVGP